MARPGVPGSSLRRGWPLWARILVCSAALGALVLAAVPGGRSFASGVAGRIVHLRPGSAGPIPFILDLNKHKRAPKAPAKQQKPAKRTHTDSPR